MLTVKTCISVSNHDTMCVDLQLLLDRLWQVSQEYETRVLVGLKLPENESTAYMYIGT